jgi:glucose/arabinose dehydrogenase
MPWRLTLTALPALTLLFTLAASAADAPQSNADALRQNFLAEHEIGHRYQIDPGNLPPPKTGAIVTNRPLTLPYTGQAPQVPPGFSATAFATGLAHPRRLLVLGNGDVLERRLSYLVAWLGWRWTRGLDRAPR